MCPSTPTTNWPSISVIICTKDRQASLLRTLTALQLASREIENSYLEIVVVDNNSTDGTSAVAHDWLTTSGMNFQIIKEMKRGIAAARNAGIKTCVGDLIAYTDDDCSVGLKYFSTLRELYGSSCSPAIFGGRVELGDPLDLPMTIKTDPHVQIFDGHGAGGFILGCNMVMNRAVYETIGAWDERFGAGTQFMSGEDTDYIYRAHLLGIPITYTPELLVMHYHGRRNPCEIQTLFYGYNVGNGALFCKYFNKPFAKQMIWNMRSALRELIGWDSFKPDLGLSYRRMAYGNIVGVTRYLRNLVINAGK